MAIALHRGSCFSIALASRSDPRRIRMKLSVLIRTFNHERFIVQAIESVLVQHTSFDYEIVIGDDCSTDGTRVLLQEFASLYPGRIRPLLHASRTGARGNFEAVLQACRGEYVAVLDGDDYWTTPRKLQEQVDFLDAHPGCPCCCHNAKLVSEAGDFESGPLQTGPVKQFLGVEDLLDRSPALHSTMMMRREAALSIHDTPRIFLSDKARAVALAYRYGRIGYLDQTMSAWRMHAGSMVSGKHVLPLADRRIRSHGVQIEFYEAMDRFLGYAFHAHIARLVVKRHYALAWCHAKKRRWSAMLEQLGKGWRIARRPGEASSVRSTGVSLMLLWQALRSSLPSPLHVPGRRQPLPK
jgi:glycosyltransferase involved in cell wall biosynthesis